MSVINPNTFRADLTNEEVYTILNTMGVDYFLFANHSHYYGRLYGVITGDDSYGDLAERTVADNFIVNECLREAVWRTLYNVQEETERYIGYNVSPRYHEETLDWCWERPYKTFWPGIELVDIEPSWSTIAGYDEIAVSPFVEIGLVAVLGVDGWVLTLDSDVVNNPNDVHIRRDSDNGTIPIKYENGYPRRNVGGDWEVILDSSVGYSGEVVNVQHTKYVFVDITPPTSLECSGEVFPVYAGTNQIIKEAKPMQVVGSDHRYWFYNYQLVDPSFYTETTNLLNGEFYKLLEFIEFKCFREVASKGTLTKTCRCESCGCEDKRYEVTTTILDAAYGIVRFCVTGEIDEEDVVTPLSSGCCPIHDDNMSDWSLTFKYKTSPKRLKPHMAHAVSTVQRAILHKAAADLPVADCGCHVVAGFIWEQQKSFATVKVNTFTGERSEQFRYGDLQGQKVYAELIEKIPVYKYKLL